VHGASLSDAMVLVADAGFMGSARSASNGRFVLEHRGDYISVRHPEFKSKTIRIDEGQEYVEIRLERIDGTEWQVPRCKSLPDFDSRWYGG
jgi:hypothetical protein